MDELSTATLPTHIARTADRLNLIGPEASGDTFLTTSYLVECLIKTIAAALHAGLRTASPDTAYPIAYELVRADGLGTWDDAIRGMCSHPVAGYLPPDFYPSVAWITKKRTQLSEDSWLLQSLADAAQILDLLGREVTSERRTKTVANLLTDLVLIRNKTKAHGAVGPDFFSAANPPYVAIVGRLVTHCPLLDARWMHLSIRPAKKSIRGISLLGSGPKHMRDADTAPFAPNEPGPYIVPGKQRAFWVGDLLRTNLECTEFFLPNGGYRSPGVAEYLDYATGASRQIEVPQFSLPPGPLPASETEGLPSLDVQSNVFGNLPSLPTQYVSRPAIEQELTERLLDHNHPIITLHGRGGVGKTSLALHVAHSLAQLASPPFDAIVWFSARDVDLRPSGPARVRTAVPDLHAICKSYGALFGVGSTEEDFALVLRGTSTVGTLFIFDNFETVDAARHVHQFLDTHTHIPNKILITSRERAFKADYPIEVHGMEYDEAEKLIRMTARHVGAESLITSDVVRGIFDYTDGHVYVMKLLVGEIAKERRYVPPRSLLPHRQDIVDAVFERSFNKLSDVGRWVFLLVANWRSVVSELSLLVVCAERGLDAGSGLEECVRFSLINLGSLGDDQPCYHAPELARIFGRKKLESDPDRFTIQEDLERLQRFGVLATRDVGSQTQQAIVERFASWAFREAAEGGSDEIERLDRTLMAVAELWAPAWAFVAKFRHKYGMDRDSVEYAYRRLVEERPFDKGAWLARAEYALSVGDEQTYLASLVSAIDADPSDVELVRDTALTLCKFIDAHRLDIPRTRRGVYLAGVRAHMEKLSQQLDATGLSRLAWLFLLEADEEKALEFASLGLRKDPWNHHCQNLVERLRGSVPRRRR